MPTPDNLESIEVTFEGGYFPSAAALSPKGLQSTIRRGNNVWLRPGGKIEVAKGPLEVSAQNVGARLFAADTQRASIAGGLVGNRLPYAGLLRHQNAVILFLSENTSSQVFLNETAVSGLITSSTAGRLRVAVPDGVGGYSVFDAGFDKPPLAPGGVITFGSGVKDMQGFTGIALARWRTKSNAWSQPSDVVYQNMPGSGTQFGINPLPSSSTGQDGWLLLGTRWGDRGGQLRIVRYIYNTVRGTFSATNGVQAISGLNTFWTRDLNFADAVSIDGSPYTITGLTDDDTAEITPAYAGVTGSGKTMTMIGIAAEWYDSDLLDIVDRDIQRPLRAAGITKFAERLFLWGIPDTNAATASDATGNGFAVMLDGNPEHIGTVVGVTASGSNFVNALAGDGAFYFMTTTSLEVIDRKGTEDQPFLPRIVGKPGFKAATNGCLYLDWFYGFTNRPMRTRARENIDVLFAAPVWDDMKTWNGERVIVQVDPDDEAVLYFYDDGATTTVRPWMTQQNVWNPPINLSARVLDASVVDGHLYVTYLSGGNIRVNQWEGGAGIGGSPYVSSQFYDLRKLARNRIKNAQVAGKVGSLSVFAAKPGAPVPDVSNLGAAEVTFTESDLAEMFEGKNGTNIEAAAGAFRVDFPSADGAVQKIVARGIPRGE